MSYKNTSAEGTPAFRRRKGGRAMQTAERAVFSAARENADRTGEPQLGSEKCYFFFFWTSGQVSRYRNGFEYPSFIQDTFKGIYYLDQENEWLDIVTFNIRMLSEKYSGDMLRKKRALAYHALFQACLCKRPFNMFHRNNLYLRTAHVKRTFKNKATWDKKFPYLFEQFHEEISKTIFRNKHRHKAICKDIFKIDTGPGKHSPKSPDLPAL
jgi:hypothetical protein